MAHITVVGAGYVGLCTGLVFAEMGHDVTFVDAATAKLDEIRAGRSPFVEPGIEELLHRVLPRVRLSREMLLGEFVFLCVGTPQDKDGSIDLSSIRAASADIGRAIAATGARPIVVVKSTVVPGTAEDVIAPVIARAASLHRINIASNPEFLKEGSALDDARRPERVVVGARTREAAEKVLALYAGLPGERVVVSSRAAEMIKYSSNAMLAAKVALSNELANVAAASGVDWYEIAPAVGADSRIGPKFLRAGVGFGGSCFPKDLKALHAHAAHVHVPTPILDSILHHNDEQPRRAIELLREELGDLRGKRIALLGLSFKPDTDDVRESRALPLWRMLVDAGADVVCHDPAAGANFAKAAPGARVAASLDEALNGADAALLQTEWKAYRELAPAKLPSVVVDGRRTFAPDAMRAAGRRYRAIGLGPPNDNAE